MKPTIFRKLLLGFAAIVALTVALAVYQLDSFATAVDVLDASVHEDTATHATIARIAEDRAVLQSQREAAVAAVIANDVDGPVLEGFRTAYGTALRLALADLAELEARSKAQANGGVTEARRALWRDLGRTLPEVASELREIDAQAQQLFTALGEGRLQDARAVRRSLNQRSAGVKDHLDDARALALRLTDAGRDAAARAFNTVVRSTVIAVLLVVIAATVIAMVIGRSVSIPLTSSIALAQRIGEGDLSAEMAAERRDELGDLARALNGMIASLRRIATQTRGAAENLNGATAQIRASAQEQAAAVAQQLAAIEQTSATLTEMTQSGAHMSERARQVIGDANDTAGSSEQGLRAVEDTVAVMDGIRDQVETVAENIVMLSQRTQAIGDIILTVSTIAERSHLLALNAAIEAAAAGEHGRTFSVVANEIKQLADQARDATAQVRSNLGDIQQGINASVMLTEEAAKRVTSGRRQTEAAEGSIRRMTGNIQDSVQAFQQIVASINQHQIGLEQVMLALNNIRAASTQTSSSTRQLEEAAVNMNTLSEGLLGAVRNYQV